MDESSALIKFSKHGRRNRVETAHIDVGLKILSQVTNAVLVAYTNDTFDNLTTVTRLLLFACYEYALIGLKLTYQITVDDVPDHVVLQVARSDFLSRKIVSNERDEQKGAVDVDAVVETTVVHQSDPEMAGDGANLA